MNTFSVDLASTAATQGFVLFGHDIDGWTVALIAAGIAAVVYEVVMALTKMVTLRIPFLVLQIARLVTPKSVRADLYKKWKADLWYILRSDGLWITKFIRGMWFALQLAFYGARSTASVVDVGAIKGAPLQLSRLIASVATCMTTSATVSQMLDLSGAVSLVVMLLAVTLGTLVGVVSMGLEYMSRSERDK
ncbi:hypothetical protein ACFW19_13230 [Streptomyces nigra]|uniref:hypothetical protein n=1 Tax=Streptomyces nigra TaxID=1827580 RepID=UPI0036D08E39